MRVNLHPIPLFDKQERMYDTAYKQLTAAQSDHNERRPRRHKMAQIEENFYEIPALFVRQLTSSPSSCNAIQLYNNDENAAKCHTMPQIYNIYLG